MSISNINITTPNSGNLYFVKADAQPTYDYTQCPKAEATHLAVLRYIPQEAEVVAGEVYADETALVSLIKFPITFNEIAVDFIDIFVKITGEDDSTYIQVGKSLDATLGSVEFGLLPSDFAVGDFINVKVKDVDSDIFAITESHEILPSFTLVGYPVSVKGLGTLQTFSGTGLSGKQLTITLSSTTGEKVVTTTPVAEEWSEDIALTPEDGFNSWDNVNVKISRTDYDNKDYGLLYYVVGTLGIETGLAPFITDNIELDKTFTISVACVGLEGKNIIIEAQLSDGDWSSVTQIGMAMVAEGHALVNCTVPATSFDVNDDIEVRARYGTLASVAEELNVVATVTITGTPTTVGVEEDLEGASNGAEVEGFYKLASAEGWTSAGTVYTVAGAYTIPITIADAGTYDFMVVDTTDSDGNAQVEDVVVASGEIMIDDFEGYVDGADIAPPWVWLAGQGAIIATSTDKYSGFQSGRIYSASGQYLIYTRGFTRQNVNGKTLSFRIKFQNYDITKTSVSVTLFDGSTNKQNVGTKYVGSGWVLFSGVCDNIDCDTVQLSLNNRWGGYIYIDDIKIG